MKLVASFSTQIRFFGQAVGLIWTLVGVGKGSSMAWSGCGRKDELGEFKLALPPANHIFL
jgi:hypothetical protein